MVGRSEGDGFSEFSAELPLPPPPPPFWPAAPDAAAIEPSVNPLCVASLTVSLAGLPLGLLNPLLPLLSAAVAVVCGVGGRSEVRKSDGAQTGAGLALAGLTIGIATIVLMVAVAAILIYALSHLKFHPVY